MICIFNLIDSLQKSQKLLVTRLFLKQKARNFYFTNSAKVKIQLMHQKDPFSPSFCLLIAPYNYPKLRQNCWSVMLFMLVDTYGKSFSCYFSYVSWLMVSGPVLTSSTEIVLHIQQVADHHHIWYSFPSTWLKCTVTFDNYFLLH